MTSLGLTVFTASLLLLHYPDPSHAFGWWFLWPTTTVASESASALSATESAAVNQTTNGLQIALGNRENSDTFGADGGTNISNVEVNYGRAYAPLPGDEYARYFHQQHVEEDDETRALLGTPGGAGPLSPDGWIDAILADYFRAANESRWDRLGVLREQLLDLETYADDVEGMLDRIRIAFGIELNRSLLTLEGAVLRCSSGPSLDALARAVFDGGNECVAQRMDTVRRAHSEASRNVSQRLVEWTEEQLRGDIMQCTDPSGNNSSSTRSVPTRNDIWAGNEYELACISQILHQVHLKTLLISHTSEQLTANASALFRTAKADVLQCAARLVDQAKASLEEIATITSNCEALATAEQEVRSESTST